MGMPYIPLPVDVATALLADKPRRVSGTLEGQPFGRALQGSTLDTLHVRFGRTVLKEVGKAVGDWVEVELWPERDPNHVDLPDELAAALADDDKARDRFERMTPGKRRSLCYHVTSAKRTETRMQASVGAGAQIEQLHAPRRQAASQTRNHAQRSRRVTTGRARAE